jgi:ferric-dicitrate binding protein FerR (iron transport regulator)
MEELFKRYLNNQCSISEVKELLRYFNVPENEMRLRALITESLEIMDDGDDANHWSPAIDETFIVLKKQLDAEKGKLVPIVRRTWFRVAAAAVFLVGGFALYYSVHQHQQQGLVKADRSKQEGGASNNKAILTLSDGSTISLETAEKGKLTQEGNTEISKPIEGQLLYNSLNEKPTEVVFNSIVTPRGGQYQLTLSDGSKVWLNAASSLRFPASFTGKERKVALTGEAYFEVAKNASMPFKVSVPGKAEVEVLGTHFNVNAYSDEAAMNTTLLEGSVKVIVPATRESRIIVPGEQAQLHGDGQINVDKNANMERAMAWKNGTFNFSNEDFEMVFRQLSRWYDVDVVIKGQLPKRHFTGEIPRSLELPEVLKLLEKNNVSCKLEGKKLIVLQ